MDICGICGEDLESKFKHKLICGHVFHYECLYNTFRHDWLKSCPYCRQEFNVLPLVNGLKHINKNIHQGIISDYINIPCDQILKVGKNKGNKCNNNCLLGRYKCKRHFK